MKNYTDKINLLENKEYNKKLNIYLKHSIFDLPELGETIYGKIIIHKTIQEDKFMECKSVKITTMSDEDKPFEYVFINDPNNYLIESINFPGRFLSMIKSKVKNNYELYGPVEIDEFFSKISSYERDIKET